MNIATPARLASTLLACCVLLLTALSTASAQTDTAPKRTFAQKLQDAGVKIVEAPSSVPLGSVAEFKLPNGCFAIAAESMRKFYELTENVYAGNEVGVIISAEGWMLFFDYDDVGHVKDDEKNELNADKLLSTMRKNQERSNEQRAKQGWDQMKIAGWAAKPHYDDATHNLKWAVNLTSLSDNHASSWINENIRLLGRGGVMNVTLVTDSETFAQDSASADKLLAANFGYVAGQRYAEFREGDKLAKYGLSALVLGGGAAAAYKLGFLQKFWKVIAGAGLAVAAALRKMWNKITGRDAA